MEIAPRPVKLAAILILGALAASTAALWIRLVLDAVDASGPGVSFWIAAVRLGIAALVFLPGWQRFRRRRYSWSQGGYSIAAGACLALHFGAWISSLSYTSITASTVLVTTTPLWIALVSWLLWRERPTDLTSLGMVVALGGGIAMALVDGNVDIEAAAPVLGNVLALFGAWAVTGYLLLGRAAQGRGMTTGHHVMLAYSVAAALLLLLTLIPQLLGVASFSPPVEPPLNAYGWLLALALLPQLLGHSCLNWSVRWVSPTLVSLTILTEPLVASLLGYFVFNEQPTAASLGAASFVLLGVLMAVLGSRFTLADLFQKHFGRF